MNNFHYHFLESNTGLSEFENDIQRILSDLGERMISITEAVKTEVVVEHNPENCIPELGIGGQYTKADNCINIYLNLTHSHLRENLEQEISRTFVHEYMHALREHYVPWENGTLLDALVAEGLTQSFEIYILPNLTPAIYTTVFTDKELDELWNNAKPVLYEKKIVDDWFYGNTNIKRWAGYSLGYKLVQDKIKDSGLKASQLYKLPSIDFLP